MLDKVKEGVLSMKTHELEKELGISKHTIFYYEKEGIVTPQRDDNGYRSYSQEDLQKLIMVKFLRNLNISLNTHKPQVCYKHVFNKFLLNSIRNKEQTKIKKTVSADYGYSNKISYSRLFVCLIMLLLNFHQVYIFLNIYLIRFLFDERVFD